MNSSSGAYHFNPNSGVVDSQSGSLIKGHLAQMMAANSSMNSDYGAGRPINLESDPRSLQLKAAYQMTSDSFPTKQVKRPKKKAKAVKPSRYERSLAGTRFAVESKQSRLTSKSSGSRRASTSMQAISSKLRAVPTIPLP